MFALFYGWIYFALIGYQLTHINAASPTLPPTPCHDTIHDVDLIIILDSSGSVRDPNNPDGQFGNWYAELDFAKYIVNNSTNTSLPPNHSRVGLINFSGCQSSVSYEDCIDNMGKIRKEWGLNTFGTPNDLESVYNRIDAMDANDLVGGQTWTNEALHIALTEFQYNSSATASKTILLLTDGQPYPTGMGHEPCIMSTAYASNTSQALKDLEVRTIVIGMAVDLALLSEYFHCVVQDTNDLIAMPGFDFDALLRTEDITIGDHICTHPIPTLAPSSDPSASPSSDPSRVPSRSPSSFPTLPPTIVPTLLPTAPPTIFPTSRAPSLLPTSAPIVTASPTITPSRSPTLAPLAWDDCVVDTIQSGSLFLQIFIAIKVQNRQMKLVLTGPKNTWFGIGFGAHAMNNTRVITISEIDGTVSVTGRRLGYHVQGETISNVLNDATETVMGGTRSITILNAWSLEGLFDFSDFFEGTLCSLPIIWAGGVNNALQLSGHGTGNRGSANLYSCMCTQEPTSIATDIPSNAPTHNPIETAPPTTTAKPTTAPTMGAMSSNASYMRLPLGIFLFIMWSVVLSL
eukprot:85329_1